MDNIYERINEFYNKKGFLDKYGGDLYLTIFIVLAFLVVFSYFSVFNNVEKLKSDWANKRCSPEVIPFAGYVNAPEGTSKFKYTLDNFNGCINNIFKTLGEEALQPVYYIIASFKKVLTELLQSLTSIRASIDKSRNFIADIFNSVYNTLNVMSIVFVKLSIVIKDTFGKIKGILTGMIYSLFGSYLAFGAFLGTIYNFLIVLLIGIGILMVIFWASLQFGLAAVMTGIFGTLAAMTVMTSKLLKNAMAMKDVKKVPKKPRCFDEGVTIELISGISKPIAEIVIGDVLKSGAKVTAVMKLSSSGEAMYSIRNVIVSGEHHIFLESDSYSTDWIKAKDHPESQSIANYGKPIIYCLGTENKQIEINGLIFADWDEVGDYELRELKRNARLLLPSDFKKSDMHKYIDGGFVGETPIELDSGSVVKLESVKPNDVLKFGVKVLGIVKIDARDITGVYEYEYLGISNTTMKCHNIQFYNSEVGLIDTLNLTGNKLDNQNSPDFIYHLVTDKTIFYVNGGYVTDYNACMDKFVGPLEFDAFNNCDNCNKFCCSLS